jgi:hypothetical protein
MQDEGCWLQVMELHLDGIKVFCAFRQDQHLASLRDGIAYLGGDGCCSGGIVGEMSENILDASLLRQVDPDMAGAWHHLQIVRRPGRFHRRVTNRPALHEDDRLLSVAADRCGRGAQHVFRLGPFEDRVEGDCADMVALVDDHLPIVLDQRIHLALAGQGLHHGDIDLAGGFGLAAADGADNALGDP